MENDIHRITVQDTGQCFPCREGEFLLAAMQRAGRALIPHGCHGGGCGVCRMRVVRGLYTTPKRMSRTHVSLADEQRNHVLLCCITPRGDMTIAQNN